MSVILELLDFKKEKSLQEEGIEPREICCRSRKECFVTPMMLPRNWLKTAKEHVE